MARVSTESKPPTTRQISRFLREGMTRSEREDFPTLFRHLKVSNYVDDRGQVLHPTDRLAAHYERDGLVLFLGAGVSVDSGIPNWHDLAERVLCRSGITNSTLTYQVVERAFPTLISQFDLVAHKVGAAKLITLIYECLYANFSTAEMLMGIPGKNAEQVGWGGWRDIHSALARNRTLKTVGDLLFDHSLESARNRRIHSVITVNSDNLLELYCQARADGARILTTVDRASIGDHPDKISIYHLHGTLDARKENFLRRENFPSDLLPDVVFTESQYYNTIANPGSFVNHTPQSILRQHNVLFIGISLDDLNIRRWLHSSYQQRVEHRTKYLREYYRKNYAAASFQAEWDSMRHFWFRTMREGLPQDEIELSMRKLGVQVIWCKDHAEARRHIRALTKVAVA